MVIVECRGDRFEISEDVAKTLLESGYICRGNSRSLYHPTPDYTMMAIRFFAAAIHEDGTPIAVGASFQDFLDHEKTLSGRA